MVIGIIALVIGVLLGAAAVVFRKKIPQNWMISMIAAGVLVAIVGGIFTGVAVSASNRDKQNIRIALNYLERQCVTEASYYLKKVESDTLCSLGTETLLEVMRGNDILARFKLDSLEGKAKSDGEKSICLKLSVISRDDYSTQTAVINVLKEELKLSKSKAEEADIRFCRESGYYIPGIEMDDSDLSEEESLRLSLNSLISNKQFSEAARIAAELVHESPNAKNRLLLADIIAQAAYDQNYLTGAEFMVKEGLFEAITEYRQKLQKQIDSLTLDLNATRELLNNAMDEEKSKKLQQEVSNLNGQIMKLQSENNYLLVDRAFNSIADLGSLEAAVVRARLHFAKKDYEKAMLALEKAVSNPIIRMSASGDVKNAVNILHKTLKNDGVVGSETPEFQDAINTLMSNVGNDMVSIHAGDLSNSFSEYISTTQKTYGKDLYVSHVDTTQYPKVVITLSGRDTVLDRVAAKKEIVIRDTHNTVTFTVEKPDGKDTVADICCVVDESGSMSGQPMEDLKTALSGFINSLQSDASIGIVGFSDSYVIRAPLSNLHESAAAAVGDIYASGGTDISSGISGGLEVLQESTKQKVILLMTDGQSSIDMSVVEQAAQTGTVIHCIGFGGVNDDLLQTIADATGGQYIRADSSSELINVYLSLVGVIGNHIKITYTVDTTGSAATEEVRYFFVRDTLSGTSVRVDYVLDEPVGPQVNQISNQMVTTDELQRAANRNEKLYFYLYGTGLSNIVSAKVGSAACTVTDVSSDSITLEVDPTMNPGWHTVLLTDKDGKTYQFDKAIVVGDDISETQFTMGQVYIQSFNTCLLSDGTLVFENCTVKASQGTGLQSVLRVEGLLRVQINTTDFDTLPRPGSGDVSIGDAGTLYGFGSIRMSQFGDIDYGGGEALAKGAFHLDCGNGKIRLIQD